MINPHKDWIDRSIQFFGLTDDPQEAGYILPDGSMLDFTGRSQIGDYVRRGQKYYPKRGRDYMLRSRGIDHREITSAIEEMEEWLFFMQLTGSIRLSHHGYNIYIMFSAMPTPLQIKTIKNMIRGEEYLAIDILHPSKDEVLKSFEFDPARKFHIDRVIQEIY